MASYLKMQNSLNNVSHAIFNLSDQNRRPLKKWEINPWPEKRSQRPGFQSYLEAMVHLQMKKEATKVAQKIGFPVIIKAVSGGGGRGMRIAHNAVSFAKEFLAAKLEAEKAFGDGSLYVEKYLESPRHIEFQILSDKHGNMVHLGERDCSVQRRHQKVIEEAPSPFLDKSLRNRMGKAAIKAAQAADYINAGTIEFLVDAKVTFISLK